MPEIVSVRASSTRWEWGLGPERLNPFSALYLAHPNPTLSPCWNAGRFAPVTLDLAFSDSVRRIRICPEMVPESGTVGVVVVNERKERVAHCSQWRDGVWVVIDIPPSRRCRLEFVESPSWIAVRSLRFE